MRKTYLLCDPQQQSLLPAALQEWSPDDHAACFVSAIVDHLDLSALAPTMNRRGREGPSYHPRIMV